MSKDEKIMALQEEYDRLNAKKMTTTSASYGLARPETLEKFPLTTYNIKKNEDLMPCPRRPPAKK